MQTSVDYFRAVHHATELAKSNVFPGSETAYFDAMRTAHQVASEAAPVPLPVAESAASGDPEVELNQVLSNAFAEEGWQRAINALMVAAGALVLRETLRDDFFDRLLEPTFV
jgi:riboflavin biosynthesis pyrimidine reductase